MSGAQAVASKEMAVIAAAGMALPKLVVFDLDGTLWPFWCERRSESGRAHTYPDVMPIIGALRQRGIAMAVASRSPDPSTAAALLRKFGLSKATFCARVINPSWPVKTLHFSAIHKHTGIEFGEMLFFDDNVDNVQHVRRLGVTCVVVRNGLNLADFVRGMRGFAMARTRQ